MGYFIYFKKLAEECVVGGIGEEMLKHFAFRKGDLRAVSIWRKTTPPLFARCKFHPETFIPTEIVKLLVWTTTWSCSLIEYRLYNEVLSRKSSE